MHLPDGTLEPMPATGFGTSEQAPRRQSVADALLRSSGTGTIAMSISPEMRASTMSDRKSAGSDQPHTAIVLSVIIATYNARQLLDDCLTSIAKNPPSEPYEVIVVDDASADGTSDMVRTRFPDVRLLRNEVNRHYAFSNNRALECARGAYLFLLNNDTIVLPQALDRMVEFLREHPDAGAVGCRLLNEDSSIQWSVKSLPNPGSGLFGARSIITRLFPNNPFSRRHLLHLDRDMTAPFAAGYVSSAAVMIPRHVIDKVGGLDRRLSYHVDADYCKRIADTGHKSYYLPTATIIHLDHRGGTMVSLRRRFRSLIEFHVGSYIYYRKHVQKSAWAPMHIVVVLGLLTRFGLSVMAQAGAELASMARGSRSEGSRPL
jgi:GT2 family glycosyltransferase